MDPITATILTATTVASTVNQVVQGRRADKANKKRTLAENRIQERRAQREKLDQLRQARIAVAQNTNVGATTGTGESTGVLGANASTAAQYGANVGYIESNMGDAREAAFWGNRASSAATDAATSGAIGNLAGQTFSQFGGAAALQKAWNVKFGGK